MSTDKHNQELYTLSELVRLTGIGQNTLRYHLKKLNRFFQLPRDRYNRFLFTAEDVQRIQQIDQLKQQGLDYLEISMELLEVEGYTNEKISPKNTIKDKNKQKQQKNVYPLPENDVSCTGCLKLEKKINELQEKIDSLEQRVSLLIEFQTKFMIGGEVLE